MLSGWLCRICWLHLLAPYASYANWPAIVYNTARYSLFADVQPMLLMLVRYADCLIMLAMMAGNKCWLSRLANNDG